MSVERTNDVKETPKKNLSDSPLGKIVSKIPSALEDPKRVIPEAVGDAVGIAVGVATKSEVAGSAAREVSKRGTEIAMDKIGEMIDNKRAGLEREKQVRNELENKYPGATIVSEAYLRDKNGNIVKDPKTGAARRVDFVVVKNGKVIDSVEVTSKTAEKGNQIAKENRIRENGGNYIKDANGNLIRIPDKVTTRIERRD